MIEKIFYGLVGAITLFVGCTYEPAFNVTCTDEGAQSAGRVCQDGVWIRVDGADMPVDPDMPGEADGGCIPETDAQMCQRLGLTCADVTGEDNCMVTRTINCGSCSAPGQTCGGGGTDNVCACSEQSDIEFCSTNGKACDPFTAEDACGDMRTVNCGMCEGVASCAADNTCTCDVVFACEARNATCGMVDVTGECAGTDSITCGTCDAPNSECLMNQCACADGYEGDGTTCDDVDECADGTDNCDANAECTNTPGSFECMCDPGYAGDGTNCVQVATLVSAVETVEINMPDDSATVALPNSVTAANSVPFMTVRLEDTDAQGNRIAVDVSLTNDEVTVERDNGNGDAIARVYVAEFDPMFAAVQSGTFSFSGTSHAETLTNTVNRDESFIVFYFQRSGGNQDRDDLYVAGDLSMAGDEILFERDGGDDNVDGHYWVVSAVNSAFSVQHLNETFGNIADIFSAPQSVDQAKSFIMYSWTSDFADDDANRTQVNCNLISMNDVRCRTRSVDAVIPTLNIQLVSLTASEVVQRGVLAFAADQDVRTAALQSVGANALAFGGALGIAGVSIHNTSSGSETPGGFFTHTITSATEISIERGQPRGEAAEVVWQVIDW